jgi:hypothetical protein
MKTKIMIPAMFACALAFSPFVANSSEIQLSTSEIVVGEKTKLDIENLPEVLKNAIEKDNTAAALTIKEAWHIEEEGELHYKVTFDMAGEDFVRKYDAQGNVIEDTQV